jgi:hypothetical protein
MSGIADIAVTVLLAAIGCWLAWKVLDRFAGLLIAAIDWITRHE